MGGFSKKEYLQLKMPTEEVAISDQKRIELALSTLGYEPVSFPNCFIVWKLRCQRITRCWHLHIPWKCVFYDSSHFIAAFKKRFNCTPAVYKKQFTYENKLKHL